MDHKRNEEIKAQRRRQRSLERDGNYWTEDETAMLEAMYEDGEGISDIALKLKRTERAVMQEIMLLDLYRSITGPLRTTKAREPKCQCENCKVDPSQCPRYCMKGDGSDV